MRRRQGMIGNESGQAIFEYILVLIIVVIIVFSVLYRFSTAFRAYGNNYFTNYVACLLDYGELPGSGSCTDQMASFQLADGRVLSEGGMDARMNGGGGGGGGNWGSSSGGSGGSSGGKDGSSGDAGNSSGKDGDGKSGNSSGGNDEKIAQGSGGAGGGGGGGVTPVGKFDRFGKTKSAPVGNVKAGSGDAGAGADSLLGVSPTSTAVGAVEGRGKKVTNLTWSYGDEEKQKQEMGKPSTASAGKPIGNTGDELRPKTAVEKVREVASKKADLDDSGFSFGKLIKLLLIIAIILAIVVFFGGQVLQMTKSWDSN